MTRAQLPSFLGRVPEQERSSHELLPLRKAEQRQGWALSSSGKHQHKFMNRVLAELALQCG